MNDLPSSRVKVIRDTSSYTGAFTHIQCLSDCVITSMTSSAEGSVTSLALPAGTLWRLDITQIQLTSGDMSLTKA
jgi:hypothetical protein